MFTDFPSPAQVSKELEYLKMRDREEERETERILRRAEVKKAERRRKFLEWIAVGITILGVAYLTFHFSGTPSMHQ